jgi:hypothetical protein
MTAIPHIRLKLLELPPNQQLSQNNDVKRFLRVYADTSVFGGCFDEEFRIESLQFFEEVRQGRFVVVISNVTLDELELAPDRVRRVLAGLPPQQVEIVNT